MELMSSSSERTSSVTRKRKHPQDERTPGPSSHRSIPDPATGRNLNATHGREALLEYMKHPEAFPSPARVVYHNDHFVAIHDLYPKSTVHMLLLPRDMTKTLLHPFDALEDEDFLVAVNIEVAKLKDMIASELRRKHASVSASEQTRNVALEADDPPDKLPDGRAWGKEVRAGVHAHPSMTHLHVHVMSVDRHSECMRHRKHYNSFATPFFVPIEDLPLAKDDPRRHPGREGYLKRDLICWRCGKSFGNKFKELKGHLQDEYEAWRRE